MIRLGYENDTIMIKTTQKQQKILQILLKNNNIASSIIHKELGAFFGNSKKNTFGIS